MSHSLPNVFSLLRVKCLPCSFHILPINGLSEVMGMIAETVLRKIVRERRMVTPGNKNYKISERAFSD